MATLCIVKSTPTFRKSLMSMVVSTTQTLILCIALLLLTHVVAEVDDGDSVDHEFDIVTGSPVSVPCDFTVEECGPVHSVKIFKDGNRVFTYNNNTFPLPPEIRAGGDFAEHKGRLYFDVKGSPVSLHLSQVFLVDEGLYRCEVTYLVVTGDCETSTTSVLRTLARPSPPEIRVNGDSYNMTRIGPFREETRLSLTCESSEGRPPARVRWWNGTEDIDDDDNDDENSDESEPDYSSSIDIVLSRYDLYSRFECHAINEALDAPLVNWIEVDVQVRPLTVDIIAPERPVREGTMVTLGCIVTGARPAAAISWFNGTNEVDNEGSDEVTSDSELTFTTRSKYSFMATMHDHKARVRCVASNVVNEEKGTEGAEEMHIMNVQYAPRVSVLPDGEMTVNYSGTFELHCRYDANPMNLTKVLWYRNGEEIDFDEIDESDEVEGEYTVIGHDDSIDSDADSEYDTGDRIEMISGEFFEDHEDVSEGDEKDSTSDEDGDTGDTDDDKFPSLVVKSVMHVDKGFYTCQVVNEMGLGISNNALNLDVYYPPMMEVNVEPDFILDGEEINVTLSCKLLTANPPISFRYMWLRNGLQFKETYDDELVLHDVDPDDTGNYSCAGLNELGWGRESKRKQFLVKYPPGASKIDYTFPVIKGHSVTLTCHVKDLGQPPADTYSWYRNDVPLIDVTDKDYYIQPVTLRAVSNFTCAAVNDVGEGPQATAKVEINAAPTLIQPLPDISVAMVNDSVVSFSCHIECSPKCTPIQWLRNDFPIMPSDYNRDGYKEISITTQYLPSDPSKNLLTSVISTLVWNVSATGRELGRGTDDADYTCKSRNNFVGASISSTTHFRVEYSPENIKVSKETITVEDGEAISDLEVECEALGFPSLKYYWLFEDTVLTKDPVLKFSKLLGKKTISKDDAGVYTCVASNKYGNLSKSVFLDVVYEPECEIEKDILQNGDVVITCTVTANPDEVKFEWRLNNKTITEGIEINEDFSKVRFHEEESLFGVYSCFASNALGGTDPVCEIRVAAESGWLEKLKENRTLFVTASVMAGLFLGACLFIIFLIIFWYTRKITPKGGSENLATEEKQKSSEEGEPDN